MYFEPVERREFKFLMISTLKLKFYPDKLKLNLKQRPQKF